MEVSTKLMVEEMGVMKAEVEVTPPVQKVERVRRPAPPHKAGARREEEGPSDLIFLPVSLEVGRLRDWSEEEGAGEKGALVEVNGRQVAVFRHGEALLATEARCPHAGGPLHLGDIEVLPDRSLCLRCPWHRWRFALGREVCAAPPAARRLFEEGGGEGGGEVEVRARRRVAVAPTMAPGACLSPPGRTDTTLGLFPVRREEGGAVSLGFTSLHTDTLTQQHF